jgi:hypothetical protein
MFSRLFGAAASSSASAAAAAARHAMGTSPGADSVGGMQMATFALG